MTCACRRSPCACPGPAEVKIPAGLVITKRMLDQHCRWSSIKFEWVYDLPGVGTVSARQVAMHLAVDGHERS